ncbi:YiiG family protein [Leptotrichia sp. oral taxon 223]|uniref:YiiG family protein n=1 Tax=Leptotrichia sp. oral taxon 223 TaxID=712363 RepID=UPI0015B81763|nr:YiiG family protein [Leptotrichia sp. oral taxon 223]NWO18306.1 YiiG family protein [Leptotrichia sp. oral taxon 223]
MNYKKIILIGFLSIFLFSCNDTFKEIGRKLRIKKVKNEEMEKYNSYIEIHNNLTNIENEISKYIDVAGEGKEINVQEMGTLESIPVIKIDNAVIQKLEKNIKSKFKMEKLDNSSKRLLPILKELKAVTDSMTNYYGKKEHLADGFAKGQQLHTNFLKIYKRYKESSDAFKMEVANKSKERMQKILETYKNEGSLIKYNLTILINSCEDFVDKMDNQKISMTTFIKGDLGKLKKAQQNILTASANFQKAIANEKQLKKENYTKEKLEIFNKQLAEFEKSVTIFIREIEKSKLMSKSEIEKKVYTEDMAGTPNDVIKKYNKLVNDYNNLMN